jgi:hypothetical protein
MSIPEDAVAAVRPFDATAIAAPNVAKGEPGR